MKLKTPTIKKKKMSAYHFGKEYDVYGYISDRLKYDIENPGKGQRGYYLHCNVGYELLSQLKHADLKSLSACSQQLFEIGKRAIERGVGYLTTDAFVSKKYREAVDLLEEAEEYLGRNFNREMVDLIFKACVCILDMLQPDETYILSTEMLSPDSTDIIIDMSPSDISVEIKKQADDVHELIPEWIGE